jgi:hypothetical protein
MRRRLLQLGQRPPIACLAAIVLPFAIGACAEGYPGASEPERRRTPAERVESLQRLARSGDSEVKSVSLRTPCVVSVAWKNGPAREYGVLGLTTIVDTDEASKHFTVFLRHDQDQAPSPLFLSTPEWATMAMARSELNQLRADCVEWKDGKRP